MEAKNFTILKKKSISKIFEDSPEKNQLVTKRGVVFSENLEEHLIRESSSRVSMRESRQSLMKSQHRKSKSYSSILKKGIELIKNNDISNKMLRIKVLSIRSNIPTKY